MYVDASALVKRYVDEAGSPTVRAVVAHEVIATSRLSEVEIASGAGAPFQGGRHFFAQSRAYAELAPGRHPIDRGSRARRRGDRRGDFAARSTSAARQDAVQLASCFHLRRLASVEVRLLTDDNRLNDAARAEGLAVVG